MDPFVKAELSKIEDSKILKVTEGKIYFSVADSIRDFNLKTAERVLILAYHQKQDLNLENKPLALLNLQKLLTEKVINKIK
jgi:hypothetical protein